METDFFETHLYLERTSLFLKFLRSTMNVHRNYERLPEEMFIVFMLAADALIVLHENSSDEIHRMQDFYREKILLK